MKSTNAKRFLNTLAPISLILACINTANTQAGFQVQKQRTAVLAGSAKIRRSGARPQHLSATSDQTNKANNNADLKLSESQKALLEGSKKAILETGMSEPYFNEHLRVVEVFDKPGDRRVVWRLSINEYETTINDSIGSYTEGTKQIDIHSVGNILSTTTDIKRTIKRTTALRIMRVCLGKFANPAVEYGARGGGKAALVLTAHSVPKPKRLSRKELRERERKREERESREKAAQGKREDETDVIDEEEEGDRPPIFLGAVNLETGKCTKGIAQAGPPKPR